jgi:hypothetical protein
MKAAHNPHWQRLQELTEAQGSSPPARRNVEPEPPRESGQRLGTLTRPGRAGKPTEELRIARDTYEGHDFISARIWMQGSDTQWYPTKRGITIRRGELAGCIKALVDGADALGVDLEEGARR